ncbi:MAG: RES family NAD+ phosphorylase [Deltaproteobacteria bacterium]|nr:RES family NAD+ phosphorylase [Deltaproteobacteria bacterium]
MGKLPELASRGTRRLRLESASARPFSGTVFRFIGSRFLTAPLSAAGSQRYGGRFNPPGRFETLYTALAADTALAEREGILLTGPGIKAAPAIRTGVLLRIACKLESVLDLTSNKNRAAIGITLTEILTPWIPWNTPLRSRAEREQVAAIAPSQQMGLAAYESGRFEAILAPSAKDPAGQCLAIFPDRLHQKSHLAVDDPQGVIRAALGLQEIGAGH